MAIPLPKRALRSLTYFVFAVFAVTGLLMIKNFSTIGNPPKSVNSINFHNDFTEFNEYILDFQFKKCSRGFKSCQLTDKDSESSLNIKWWKINKNLYLKDQNSWNWGFNDYFLFIKTINIPEIKKDGYLLENFHKKQKFVNEIAIYNSKLDPVNKHLIPTRIINNFNNHGESFTEMIMENYESARNFFYPSDKRDEPKIPTLKEVKDLGWYYVGHGLWYKLGNYDSQHSLQKIDVLFGEDALDPRPDWYMIKKPLMIDNQQYPTFLTLQNKHLSTSAKDLKKPVLKINSQGKFKILQVADLHFSTGVGKCRDPWPLESGKDCQADPRTLAFLKKLLDIEKPDFVVLTGDQIFGETSPDAFSTLLKSLAIFIDYKIPYAITMGNHDDESSLSRKEIMTIAENLPYSLSESGLEKLSGYGNYLIKVQGAKSTNPAMSLWFLDTHKYSPNPKTNPGYDWLKDDQLDWLESKFIDLKPAVNKYSHIHLSMAFWHIPIPEYRNFKEGNIIGEAKEKVTASNYNTGIREVLKKIGVSVVSVGHDHCNDYCLYDSIPSNNVWLCYGGASGEGGYGGYGGTSRRIRVFEIDANQNSINSWKRLENEPEVIKDFQHLVKGGLAVM